MPSNFKRQHLNFTIHLTRPSHSTDGWEVTKFGWVRRQKTPLLLYDWKN